MSEPVQRRAALVFIVLMTMVAALVPIVPSGASSGVVHTDSGVVEESSVGTGVTRADWIASCPEIPVTQGLDGYVFVLPEELDTAGMSVTLTGSNAANNYRLYAAVWNDDCSIDANYSGEPNEPLTMPLTATSGFVTAFTYVGYNTTVDLAVASTPTGDPTTEPTTAPTTDPGGGNCGTYPEIPNDRFWVGSGVTSSTSGGMWGMRKIEANKAWSKATGCAINVAVLDTGLDIGHPDLSCAGKVTILEGSDVVKGDSTPNDEDGHGTHVAGTIGACTNNEEGVVGVAPDSTIMPIRVLDENGNGTAGDLVKAIRLATANGAHVINMSLGFPSAIAPIELLFDVYPDINDALEEARRAGVVVVAAAGNETFPMCAHPAIAQKILCVGSSDARDLNSWYGNFPVKEDFDDGVGPGVLAPGGSGTFGVVFCQQTDEEILSTYLRQGDTCGDAGYQAIAGTSMASPHVAGVAALAYEQFQGARSEATGAAIIQAIIDNTDDLYAPGYDPASGYGRVNALKVVEALAGSGGTDPTEEVAGTSVNFTEDVPATGQFSDSVTLSALLEDESGDPIAEENLTFQLLGRDGFREETAITNSGGVATLDLVLDAPPGSYDVIVGYSGKKDTYDSSSDRQPFEILKEDSAAKISLEGNGANKTVTGTLLDEDSSRPVPQAVLAFYSNGEYVGEGITNDDGEIYFDVPGSHRRNNSIYEVRFVGNRFYLPTSATTE